MKSLSILKNAAIAVVLCAFAVGASAQTSQDTISVAKNFLPEISEERIDWMRYLLFVNPQLRIVTDDTFFLMETDTVFVERAVFVKNDSLAIGFDIKVHRPDKVVKEEPLSARLDTVSVETQVLEKLYNDEKRDVLVARRDPATDRTVVLKGANKYGLGIPFFLRYQWSENLNSFAIGSGLEYDCSWGGIYLHGEAGRSEYSSNAVHAGEDYWAFRAESALMLQLFRFDSVNQHRLFFFSGIGFESFETDSKPYIDPETGAEYEGKSWGNDLYPTLGLRYEYRPFASGNNIWAAFQYRGLSTTLQDMPNDKYAAFTFTLGFTFGVNRDKVNNTTRSWWRRLWGLWR